MLFIEVVCIEVVCIGGCIVQVFNRLMMKHNLIGSNNLHCCLFPKKCRKIVGIPLLLPFGLYVGAC